MADDNTDPVPQSAIPPKAVPPMARPADAGGSGDSPTVRRQSVPQPGGIPAPIPRTVRLKPIGAATAAGSPATSSISNLLPVTPAVPAGADAADAIKRMTARIVMMSNEGDVRVGNKRTGPIPVAGIESGAKKATTALADMGGAAGDATVRKVTSRIQMSTTAPIPDLFEGPKTIKVRPSVGGPPPSSTQPISLVESPTVGDQPFSQQPGGKATTSRIPLESAMSVPQSVGAAAADLSGGSPKTIKLKRPGEMSTIKVSVPGASAAPAVMQSAGEPPADNASITQKKTIRVKRPMAPAAASVAGGGAAGDSGGGGVVMSPVAFAPAAPERGTGWFIAVAVACLFLAIGLVGLFAVQLYGSRPHTELDLQFQKG